jgi:hypothetical protein
VILKVTLLPGFTVFTPGELMAPFAFADAVRV